jgi:hypothetical protein
MRKILALTLLLSFNSTAHVVYGVNAHHTHETNGMDLIQNGIDGMTKALNAGPERKRQAEAAEKQRQNEIRLKQMELGTANTRASTTVTGDATYDRMMAQLKAQALPNMPWVKSLQIGQNSYTNHKRRDSGHYNTDFFNRYDKAIEYENSLFLRANINSEQLANTLNYFMGGYVWSKEYCESLRAHALKYIDDANTHQAANSY